MYIRINSRERVMCNTAIFFMVFLIPVLQLKAENQWRLLIEPAFMSPPLSWKIDGAQRTVLVPAIDTSITPTYLDRDAFLKLDINKSDFIEKTRLNASKVLSQLTPIWVRDKNGIIIYATLESNNGLAVTTVFAPEFPDLFRKYLGDDLLIAIPHRDLIYIFSRQDPQFKYMSEEIYTRYRDAVYPVSSEAFILNNGKLEAIGEFHD